MSTRTRISTSTKKNGDALHLIHFDEDLSPAAARALLKLHISRRDENRMRALSAKARAGTLSTREEIEIDTFERLGCLIDILHSKARQTLRKKRSA